MIAESTKKTIEFYVKNVMQYLVGKHAIKTMKILIFYSEICTTFIT